MKQNTGKLVSQKNKYAKKMQRQEIVRVGALLGCAMLAYMAIQSIAGFLMDTSGLRSVLYSTVAQKYAFNIVVVHILSVGLPFGIVALILRNNFVSPLFPTKSHTAKDNIAWVSFGMGCCIISNIVVNNVIEFSKNVLGYKLTEGKADDPVDLLSCIMVILGTAIAPPIMEEFALRCCALGALRKYGSGFAVFAVSVVFGLLHGNMIQFLFGFMVGIVLGIITIKTDNVILAMLVHGFNNGISVTSKVLKLVMTNETANSITSLIFVGWIIFGLVAFFYLIRTHQFRRTTPKIDKSNNNSFIVKVACLIPGLAIPFALLIKLTSHYVTKI